MRKLRHALAACAAALATLALAQPASALPYYPQTWLNTAAVIANNYWTPIFGFLGTNAFYPSVAGGWCNTRGGLTYIEKVPTPGDPTYSNGAYVLAYTTLGAPCHMTMTTELYGASATAQALWQLYCYIIVHEVGHAVLGPNFFINSNGFDPAHSADPASVMNGVLGYDPGSPRMPGGCLRGYPAP